MPTAAKWKKYAGGGGELRALPAPFYAKRQMHGTLCTLDQYMNLHLRANKWLSNLTECISMNIFLFLSDRNFRLLIHI